MTAVTRALPMLLGLLLTAAAYLPQAGSPGAAALAGAGLLGCLPWRANRRRGVTLTSAAALGQFALHNPPAGYVLVVAVLLGLLLAAAEVVDSGRWRAGRRAMISTHAAPLCLGVAVTAAAVLLGAEAPGAGVPAWAAAIIGLLAAAIAIAALLDCALRLRH